MMAVMGLVGFPGPGQCRPAALRRPRSAQADGQARAASSIGKDVAMIFQDPTTSLNPCFTVGFQLAETLRLHLGMDRRAARERSIELLEQVGIPAPRSRARRLSAPALGRHEPARDDRDGDRLQPEAADRRRADHRARRHDPGADPRPAAQPAARARHGAGADQPQHGRGVGDGAARGGDVCRPGGRAALGAPALQRAAASVWRGAARGAARTQRRRRRGSRPSPAWCRACTTARRGACSRRAAPMRGHIAAPTGRRCGRGKAATCAATIRSRPIRSRRVSASSRRRHERESREPPLSSATSPCFRRREIFNTEERRARRATEKMSGPA